jgi:predicted SnoaL-like aldol condensation-catalyzing enzyme
VSIEDNKALVRRFYEEIDKGNLEAMDEFVAEDYLDHNPPPFPGLAPGREGLKQAFKIFWEATPGYHRIEDQIADGDKVVTRLTCVGKHERDLPGGARNRQRLKDDFDHDPSHREWQARRKMGREGRDGFLGTDRSDSSARQTWRCRRHWN